MTSRELALWWYPDFARAVRVMSCPPFTPNHLKKIRERLSEGRPVRLEKHAAYHRGRVEILQAEFGDVEVVRAHEALAALYLLAAESEETARRARAARRCASVCDHDGRMGAGEGRRPDCAREGACLKTFIASKSRAELVHCPPNCSRRLPIVARTPTFGNSATAGFECF